MEKGNAEADTDVTCFRNRCQTSVGVPEGEGHHHGREEGGDGLGHVLHTQPTHHQFFLISHKQHLRQYQGDDGGCTIRRVWWVGRSTDLPVDVVGLGEHNGAHEDQDGRRGGIRHLLNHSTRVIALIRM